MKWLSFLQNRQTASLYGNGIVLAIVYFPVNLWLWSRYDNEFLTMSSMLLVILALFLFLIYDSRRFSKFFTERKVRLLAVSIPKLYAINVGLTLINLLVYVLLMLVLTGLSHLIVYQNFLIPNLEIAGPKAWLIIFGFYLMLQFLFLVLTVLWQSPKKIILFVGLIIAIILLGRLVQFLGNTIFREISAIGILFVYLIALALCIAASIYLMNHFLEEETQ